jgi:hypothetical protein
MGRKRGEKEQRKYERKCGIGGEWSFAIQSFKRIYDF